MSVLGNLGFWVILSSLYCSSFELEPYVGYQDEVFGKS